MTLSQSACHCSNELEDRKSSPMLILIINLHQLVSTVLLFGFGFTLNVFFQNARAIINTDDLSTEILTTVKLSFPAVRGHGHPWPPRSSAPATRQWWMVETHSRYLLLNFFEVCFHVWTSLEPNVARLLVGIVLQTPQYASLVAQLEFDQPEPHEVKEPVAGGGVWLQPPTGG